MAREGATYVSVDTPGRAPTAKRCPMTTRSAGISPLLGRVFPRPFSLLRADSSRTLTLSREYARKIAAVRALCNVRVYVMATSLSMDLSIYLPAYLSTYLSIIYLYLSIYLSIYLYMYLSVYLSSIYIYLSMYLSIYLSIYSHVCMCKYSHSLAVPAAKQRDQ
jgi:hypothetical protein